MKKFYCFALIILTLFSCVLFSGCADKFQNLRMQIFSADNDQIVEQIDDKVRFVIDKNFNPDNLTDKSLTVGSRKFVITFKGIDEIDIGQILVYSVPNELIEVKKYTYVDGKCYVEINPNMPTSEDAKLVIKHISSGKKIERKLIIDQKSANIGTLNSKYVVSIPSGENENNHSIDFSKIYNLSPSGSTDKVYFKLADSVRIDGITFNKVDDKDEVYSGFTVSNTTVDSELNIYPVTYLDGYKPVEYKNNTIKVYFRHTLNEANVKLTSPTPIINNNVESYDNIQLIANDQGQYNTFKLNLKYNDDKLLSETNFYEMYEVLVESENEAVVSAITDGKNDIVLTAFTYTDQPINVDIKLKPINFVGDVEEIKLNCKVKGELKSESIEVEKDGLVQDTSETINIFDYYDSGTLLGSLFEFNPGQNVYEDLSKMQIEIDPEILNQANNSEDLPDNIEYKKYSLLFQFSDRPLQFSYDKENTGKMISEPFNANAKIYIKYVTNNLVTDEPTDFSIIVRTINTSTLEHLKDVEGSQVKLNFNRLKGIVSMELKAGYYISNTTGGQYNNYTNTGKLEYVYLNRLNGLDNADNTIYTISIENGSVLGMEGEILLATFTVKVEAISDCDNPLTIYNGTTDKDDVDSKNPGASEIIHNYISNQNHDVISLIFRKDTDIGEYKISFYQENILKASVIAKVYESLSESLDKNSVMVETNETLFKNDEEYKNLYEGADYIVGVNNAPTNSTISVTIPDAVNDSNIVIGYEYSYFIKTEDGQIVEFDEEDSPYFQIITDNDNQPRLVFKSGTMIQIEGEYKKCYIEVTGTIKTKKFTNTVTIASDYNSSTVKLNFYVYEIITKEDISINETELTRYPSRYLGEYYKEEASAELTVSMSDDDLWNYVTTDGCVMWTVDSMQVVAGAQYSGVNVSDNYIEGDSTCSFEFNGIVGVNKYIVKIQAFVTQFHKLLDVSCIVVVENPILTERVIITSELLTKSDENLTPYINLKEGESYTVKAENFSSKGKVSNPEIIIQIADIYGNSYYADEYFDINRDTSTLTPIKVDGLNKFRLIVFAKDALRDRLSDSGSAYNDPSNLLLNDYMMKIDCSRAYFVIDIELSDGSEYTPYLITTANDFWEIDDIPTNSNKYYKLMNNISLDNAVGVKIEEITDFSGHIVTDKNIKFTIDEITLNENLKNIFKNFSGTIENIHFVVKYAYNIDKSNEKLGVFDVNNGTLNNISIDVSGTAELYEGSFSFGSLVGINYGEIKYESCAGVSGSIELVGDGTVYFGGLVGTNYSKIIGCENESGSSTNEIILSSLSGRENVLSQIVITSTLTNEDSAIGGVIGFNGESTPHNTFGSLENAYVQANIIAGSNNVGGVIGKNEYIQNGIDVNNSDYSIDMAEIGKETFNFNLKNVKSASTIQAKNNVGGLVGYDVNGIYLDCDYQILNYVYKDVAIKANENVGGIAGYSNCGKFIFCSVMSYNWNYSALNGEVYDVIANDVIANDAICDINAKNYVGGIVGYAVSSESGVSNPFNGGNVNDKVIVAYSSVNAYLTSTSNIGGILSIGSGNSVIYSAYFIGKLEGDLYYYNDNLIIDGAENEAMSSFMNAVYSLNIHNGEIKVGKIPNVSDEFNISGLNNIPNFWYWNEAINGGYIYVTKDDENKLPIFDLVPESIDVTVKGSSETLQRTLLLDYYDFSIAEKISDEVLLELNNQYNRKQKIKDLLNINVYPENIGSVVLNVVSTKPSIVDISSDGKLFVNGIGECELIFSSVLNRNAGDIKNRTIKVIVNYPIGEFNLGTTKTDVSSYVNGTDQNIGKGSSKLFHIVTKGSKEYGSVNYSYKTRSNVNLKVEIRCINGLEINNYLNISGINYEKTDSYWVYKIDYLTPFMIGVKDKLENDKFTIKVTPYEKIDNVEISKDDKSIEFYLSTLEGIKNITFSYDEAIVYPNDTVYLTSYISTDYRIENEDLIEMVKLICEPDLLNKIIVSVNDASTYNAGIQIVKFRIECHDINIENECKLEFRLMLNEYLYECVNFKILPQRINKIEIKNYYYKNVSNESDNISQELIQQDILKPNNPGQIIIDIVPDSGYYDYLEISDITGNEEIVFTQIDENGNALSLSHDPSSDNKGIKLHRYENNPDTSRIYVRTQISNTYSSKMHTIEIRAYSSDGTLLARNYKNIDVKMLPIIKASYMLPNGQVGTYVNSSEIASVSGVYLAKNVDANILVETENANTEVEYLLSNNNDFSLVKNVNNSYTLKQNLNSNANSVKLSLKVYSILDNGDFDVAECSIEFKITNFVIHSVSVNSSIDNNTNTEIYGYINRPVKLEFYFDKYDISYYNLETNSFWDTVYRYDADISQDFIDSDLYQINNILAKLNCIEEEENNYLVLNNGKFDEQNNEYEQIYTDTTDSVKKITLKKNLLTVSDGFELDKEEAYLAVAFGMKYSEEYQSWNIINCLGTASEYNYRINKNYRLNFRLAQSRYEATVVKNQNDFEKMSSNGRYILKNDIELIDFSPIDADIVEFDGNGYTITIKSFAQFADPEIKAGLFSQIYPNMIVKNVKVKYDNTISNGNYALGGISSGSDKKIEYLNLCENDQVLFTSARFGGLTAINNGIITNCVVEGFVALSASTLEQSTTNTTENYTINFNIGGLVAENSATGYITNSHSYLQIFSQANVGGFVHTNYGKIASSSVRDNATIYSYNANLGNTIIVDIAGFVVENSGEISLSFVNLKKGDELLSINNISTHIYAGTTSAKDFSAGFVLMNSGNISDSYVQMSSLGINNNRFAGFVLANSGQISRVYTYINAGQKANKDDDMFVVENSGTISNSIEFTLDDRSIIVDGLKTEDIGRRTTKSVYEEAYFSFGDNVSAVWKIQAGGMAELVSATECEFSSFAKTIITEVTNWVEDVEDTTYKLNYAYYGTKNSPYIIATLDDWNYYFSNPNIFKTSYYNIVCDIDFASIGGNPSTSVVEFNGNIQGNNMDLSNIMLYSNNKLDFIGLFGSLIGVKDRSVVNTVRNLRLSASSVWATATSSVGILAGIAQDFNIYNISVQSPNVVVGGNVVGGVVGVVRGEFDIEQISSSVGVSSTRETTLSAYSIYMSVNNSKAVSENLGKVYYAGSIAGILDGYSKLNFNVNNPRDISKSYYKVQNIAVSGNVSNSGDTVGGAFGLIGERVYVNNVNINISGNLFGREYSGGFVGENRGVINHIEVVLADNIFIKSPYVSAGVVGFNLGGLVQNVKANANIIKEDYFHTAGGIIGRNVNGVVTNATYHGEIIAFFTGGIIGANYDYKIIANTTNSYGTLTNECKLALNLIPKNTVEYTNNGSEIVNFKNVALTNETFNKMVENSTKYYTYQKDETIENPTLEQITVGTKVLGLIVGLSYDSGDIVSKDNDKYYINTGDENYIIFNNSSEGIEVLEGETIELKNDISFKFDKVNVTGSGSKNYVMYLVGSVVSNFDSWNVYSNQYIIVRKS